MPVLSAAGAGVRHRRRWLFRDLDVSVESGETVAIVGPPGSGRTTVLLALSRHFKLSAGRVTGSASLGSVPGVTSPEPVLTVREHVRERLLLTGRSPREADQVPLLGLDPGAKGYELGPYQRQALGLVLARLAKPRVIALDAVDVGLDEQERQKLWKLLGSIAEDGIALLITARDIDPARVSTVVCLAGSEPAAVNPAAVNPAAVNPATEEDEAAGKPAAPAAHRDAPAEPLPEEES